MRYLSLFSGIEAASVAWEPLGWECAGVAEVDAFASAVLAHRYPSVPNLGDVTKIDAAALAALGRIDLVVFGSPCQDLSVAGKREGLAGERSGLFHAAIDIVRWAREYCGCRWALWENVPGAFSSNKGRDFATVVGELAGVYLAVPPKGWGTEGAAVGSEGMVEWAVLDAQWFGVAQRRRRVFALADFGDWAGRSPILLEPQSLRGDSPPSREPGKGTSADVAPSPVASGRGVERTGDTRGQDPLVAVPAIANPLTARMHKGVNTTMDKGQTMIVEPQRQMSVEIADTLGVGANQTTRFQSEVVAVAFAVGADCYNGALTGDVAATMGTPGSSVTASGPTVLTQGVAYGLTTEQTPKFAEDLALTLTKQSPTGGGQPRYYSDRERMGGEPSDVVHTLSSLAGQGDSSPHVATAPQVRRLTPTECERLQGFPDGWTAISYRGKPTSDGPRYKALGNSMAVPVMVWIGRRIAAVKADYLPKQPEFG